MANLNRVERALIEGKPALILIDIQASTFVDDSAVRSIDNMPGYKDRMLKAHDASLRAMEYLQTGVVRTLDEVSAAMAGYAT